MTAPSAPTATSPRYTRREALTIAAASFLPLRPHAAKKVIVAGAGIGGLSCAARDWR